LLLQPRAVASLAAAGIVGLQGGGVAQSALAATMDHLAQVAASRDWSGLPAPGQYVYIEVEGAYFDASDTTGTTCAVQLDHDQRWIQSDYSSENSHGLIYQSKFTSPTGAAGCAAIGLKDASNLDGGTITHQGPENSPFPTTVAGWQALTTDPKTLLQKIHELDGGDNTPAEEFVNISDALKAIPVPVASLQALYQAVALIPGVRLMGSQTDAAGQSGLGVEITSKAGYTSKMIFDQQTGRLLADEQYDPSGTLYQATEYVAQKIVDSAPPATR
jgi:RNA polymerase sigma-70 factor (ECF subfamily)